MRYLLLSISLLLLTGCISSGYESSTITEYNEKGARIKTTSTKKIRYQDNRALGAEAAKVGEGIAEGVQQQGGLVGLFSDPLPWLIGVGGTVLGRSQGRNQIRAARSNV